MNTRSVEGIVKEIVFTNEQNGYTVCSIETDDTEITAVGIMPGLAPGESVRLTGSWTSHVDYGEQFKATSFEKIVPTSREQIFLYLSSGIIRGIGPATAKKIIAEFGDEALDVIRTSPRHLAKIRGISVDRALLMQASLLEKQAVQNVIMFFQTYGVTPDFALKVYNRLGSTAPDKVRENPYVLCDIEGIGFKTADKIASAMGVAQNDKHRLQNGIVYVLDVYAQSGHTFVLADTLLSSATKILECDEKSVESAYTALVLGGQVIRDTNYGDERVYLPSLFNCEISVARKITALGRNSFSAVDDKKFEKAMEEISSEIELTLSESQKKVCRLALENSAIIVTGGPGTGKTTVMRAIISLMMRQGYSIALCAPTGRAAKRLGEACGIEAKTIHRLLEINFSGDESRQFFARDDGFPLDEEVVIVDEMSMVDITLMNALLKALRPSSRLIMAGDVDQLPSVGPGNVLYDLIESGAVHTVCLTEIYRRAAESMITVNAHRINHGEMPQINEMDKDFFLIRRDTPQKIADTVVDLVCRRLPAAYGYDAFSDIQVISPARKSPLGVHELNKILQAALNPPAPHKAEKVMGDIVFRTGDKVMQVRNNYNIVWENIHTHEDGTGAFNGDMGVIQEINTSSQTLSVLFDGERIIHYNFDTVSDLEPAYAVTAHKSQGSEFPVVIFPLYKCAPRLMTRNILYTALTRAKKLVVLIGREDIMRSMVENRDEHVRFSGLTDKILSLNDKDGFCL